MSFEKNKDEQMGTLPSIQEIVKHMGFVIIQTQVPVANVRMGNALSSLGLPFL